MVLNYYYTLLTEEDKKEISGICEGIHIDFNPNALVTTNASIDALVDGIVAFFTGAEITVLLNIAGSIQILISLLEKLKRISIKKQSEKRNIWDNSKINISFEIENIKILFPETFEDVTPKDYISLSMDYAKQILDCSKEPFIISFIDNKIRVESEKDFINHYSKKTCVHKVSFDYDKLAETIVKAEQKARAEENKIDDTSYFLKVLLVSSFVLVTVILWMFFLVSSYMALTGKLQPANIVETISLWVMVCMSFVYSITASFLTYKVSKINDKNYLISYFGAISGLLALIVSVLAFTRG